MSWNPIKSDKLKIMFRSLQYRNYRLFFFGQSLSLIGTWMQRIALPWLVYHMTGSVFLLGVVGFVGQIPTLLLAPVAGVLTDHWSRYRVLLISQVISMFQAFILAYLGLTEIIQIWQIIALSLVLGCINAFDTPARHSFVIDMVEKKEHLGNAIALNSMMFNGARIIGPSIAGVVLASAGEGICFLINALSYVFVIASLLMMRIQRRDVMKKETHILKDLNEGFKYTFGFPPIKHLILLLALANMMGMSYTVLMPVFAKEILHGGSHTYGFLMAAAGCGALAGALFLASRESVLTLGRLVPAAAIFFGTGLVALSFTGVFTVAVVLLVIIGLGMMLQTSSSNTIIQTITDDDKRGRVMSFYTMAVMGTSPIGNLLAGALARIIGTPMTILFSGISCIIGALFFLKKLPELKASVHPVYVKMGIIPEVAEGIQSASEPSAKIEL